jgi:signal transduction histidine kinase
MTAAAASPAARAGGTTMPDGDDRQLMSDLLHDLSQPLSTLTCLLEVNLLLSRPLKQVRHDLKIALQQIHWIVRLFRGLRELIDAGNAHPGREPLTLADCVREAVADVLPRAEQAGVKLSLSSSSGSECVVNFQASRLRQGLVHLMEFAVGSAAAGAEATITTEVDGDAARLTIAVSQAGLAEPVPDDPQKSSAESQARKQGEWNRRLGLAIARRIFLSAQASFEVESSQEGLWLEAVLPLASHA